MQVRGDVRHGAAARESDLRDPDAFGAFAALHMDSAYRRASIILRDRAAAEDAVHDAFIRAWQRRRDLRESTAAGAWFGRILVNACRDRLRRESRAAVRDVSARLHGSAGASTTGDPLVEIARRDEIGCALLRLSRDERIVLALRYGEDRTVPEIAAVLGIPEGTVKSRLHGALSHMRAALDAERRAETVRGAPR
jgi:RNA polymerase sigma-70 factor (ECF subfamily)